MDQNRYDLDVLFFLLFYPLADTTLLLFLLFLNHKKQKKLEGRVSMRIKKQKKQNYQN